MHLETTSSIIREIENEIHRVQLHNDEVRKRDCKIIKHTFIQYTYFNLQLFHVIMYWNF